MNASWESQDSFPSTNITAIDSRVFFWMANASQDQNFTVDLLDPDVKFALLGSFALATALGFSLNLLLLGYIVYKRLYRSYVSSHFIAHLTLVNLVISAYLTPIFILNFSNGDNILGENWQFACRFHAFVLVTVWTVTQFMIACIAGVHLLTYARIHYEQLFGLSPSIICAISWVIGAALGLPCITNNNLVRYNSDMFTCMWPLSEKIGYHFLAYMVLLGVFLPICLTVFGYLRVLAIFYHSPIVFEALGIFRSRYLIFALMANPLNQVPFYVLSLLEPRSVAHSAIVYPLVAFLANSLFLTNCLLYGSSLFLMKEDDMALTHKAQKHTYVAPGIQAPQV